MSLGYRYTLSQPHSIVLSVLLGFLSFLVSNMLLSTLLPALTTSHHSLSSVVSIPGVMSQNPQLSNMNLVTKDLVRRNYILALAIDFDSLPVAKMLVLTLMMLKQTTIGG